jgi:hypothetical protein
MREGKLPELQQVVVDRNRTTLLASPVSARKREVVSPRVRSPDRSHTAEPISTTQYAVTARLTRSPLFRSTLTQASSTAGSPFRLSSTSYTCTSQNQHVRQDGLAPSSSWSPGSPILEGRREGRDTCCSNVTYDGCLCSARQLCSR